MAQKRISKEGWNDGERCNADAQRGKGVCAFHGPN